MMTRPTGQVGGGQDGDQVGQVSFWRDLDECSRCDRVMMNFTLVVKDLLATYCWRRKGFRYLRHGLLSHNIYMFAEEKWLQG